MKKISLLFLILFLSAAASSKAWEMTEDGRTTRGPFVRFLIVEGRGLSNMLTFPLEIPGTAIREAKMHKWVWPVSFVPRMIWNVFIRISSAAYDIVIYPLAVPFTDDLSPLTEPLGLPEYAWQLGSGPY